ncbi:Conserved oligomeric Golgi complex component 8 [Streptomyces sp. KY75]|nr:Conserved oligomeric Golgi complex component 8 [Streptomyces sp. KY70]CAD5981166.1 Conserved oligomeric Golgi complex component 8 [Streptomyces sp. KY75]
MGGRPGPRRGARPPGAGLGERRADGAGPGRRGGAAGGRGGVRRTGDGVNGANRPVPDGVGTVCSGPCPDGAGRPPSLYRKRPAKHVFPQVKHAATAFHPRG